MVQKHHARMQQHIDDGLLAPPEFPPGTWFAATKEVAKRRVVPLTHFLEWACSIDYLSTSPELATFLGFHEGPLAYLCDRGPAPTVRETHRRQELLQIEQELQCVTSQYQRLASTDLTMSTMVCVKPLPPVCFFYSLVVTVHIVRSPTPRSVDILVF